VIMNHFWICLAISFNENFTYDQVHLYLSGIILAGITGWVCLRRIKAIESSTDLFQFHGHAYEHPRTALVFFIACLAITGFPITPTFIGEDVIFSHIHQDQYFLALFTSLSLIIDGLALIRIFARVFLGPHIKTYHETAYKSS
jgi:NADH-quinone oxidoreductase subunit L